MVYIVKVTTIKKVADMKKRCQIILESNADIVVSVHQNSFQDSSAKGAQVFYYKHSAQGKKLAECVQKSFKANLDETNNRVEKQIIHTICVSPYKKHLLLLQSVDFFLIPVKQNF